MENILGAKLVWTLFTVSGNLKKYHYSILCQIIKTQKQKKKCREKVEKCGRDVQTKQ
jgi:hypothetical protein